MYLQGQELSSDLCSLPLCKGLHKPACTHWLWLLQNKYSSPSCHCCVCKRSDCISKSSHPSKALPLLQHFRQHQSYADEEPLLCVKLEVTVQPPWNTPNCTCTQRKIGCWNLVTEVCSENLRLLAGTSQNSFTKIRRTMVTIFGLYKPQR